ncbi:MAG: hemerythrin [Burkholderiaceae bacterium]|jgi:iron-sulfur cluster repair protein YtfE (RIC family)|uniref:Hemerythrin domain-containing protein n=1 Tax=Cupriavidus metallidurans TaxID=119219 RepID=A0A482ISZ1_9BURK|nr:MULTISPECIES: hemerythrin domain-containing protein [Cupriavidus]KWR81910.1 hemerythrin [Cupriavidus sp. SHE]PCH58811.1 MAG: hemerythrin [Burkholderiaceae bacterium]QBP10259.1 hemerythrin domain-containing protein [Cupriavidus metallidurans]QWC87334.1 hemerythrin domain-containing protein [Cupriavidus metallidurans]
MSTTITTLVRQHRDCDEAIEQVEACVRAKDWDAAAGAFARLESALQGNFSTEEQRLFPAFEQAVGFSNGPTAVMRHEHDEVRGLLDNAREWLELKDVAALAAELDTLVVLLQQHNVKEENVLFPMCQAQVKGLDTLLADFASGPAAHP